MKEFRENPDGESNQEATKQKEREDFTLKMQENQDEASEDFYTILAMTMYGGEFVRRLAEAARRTDAENLRLIKKTWSSYWEKYTKLARHDNT